MLKVAECEVDEPVASGSLRVRLLSLGPTHSRASAMLVGYCVRWWVRMRVILDGRGGWVI